MAEADSMNGREFGLYPTDIGQDEKPSGKGRSRRRSYIGPIATGAVLVSLIGGAAYLMNRADRYPTDADEPVPIVREAPDIKKPDLPILKESYTDPMERAKAEAAHVPKHPYENEFSRAIKDYLVKYSNPEKEVLDPEILDIKQDDGIYKIKIIDTCKYRGRTLTARRYIEITKSGDLWQVVVENEI